MVLSRIRPLVVLVLRRGCGRWNNKCVTHPLKRTTSVQNSGYGTHTVNSRVFWLTSLKGTQGLWRFILVIAAVADPVNQVCHVKGKHNHLGFKKPTALLSLGSVLHCPLSPKLSVNNGSFCRKTLLNVASVSRNQSRCGNTGWLNARHCFWPRLGHVGDLNTTQ